MYTMNNNIFCFPKGYLSIALLILKNKYYENYTFNTVFLSMDLPNNKRLVMINPTPFEERLQ
jgi:hypothetical protein